MCEERQRLMKTYEEAALTLDHLRERLALKHLMPEEEAATVRRSALECQKKMQQLRSDLARHLIEHRC